MEKLTVVFEYPDIADMEHAERLFNNGHGGSNIAHVVTYDAVEMADEFSRQEYGMTGEEFTKLERIRNTAIEQAARDSATNQAGGS